jgi:hypothetical protein
VNPSAGPVEAWAHALSAARVARGLPATAYARDLGKTAADLSRWENAKSVPGSRAVAERMARDLSEPRVADLWPAARREMDERRKASLKSTQPKAWAKPSHLPTIRLPRPATAPKPQPRACPCGARITGLNESGLCQKCKTARAKAERAARKAAAAADPRTREERIAQGRVATALRSLLMIAVARLVDDPDCVAAKAATLYQVAASGEEVRHLPGHRPEVPGYLDTVHLDARGREWLMVGEDGEARPVGRRQVDETFSALTGRLIEIDAESAMIEGNVLPFKEECHAAVAAA